MHSLTPQRELDPCSVNDISFYLLIYWTLTRMFLGLLHAKVVALSELHRADFGFSLPLDSAAVLCSSRTEVGKT